MRYRVKRTDLKLVTGGRADLFPNVEALDIDAQTAIEAIAEFVRRKNLQLVGSIDEGTGGSANAMCRFERTHYAIIRAFPEPHPDR